MGDKMRESKGDGRRRGWGNLGYYVKFQKKLNKKNMQLICENGSVNKAHTIQV